MTVENKRFKWNISTEVEKKLSQTTLCQNPKTDVKELRIENRLNYNFSVTSAKKCAYY